MKVIQGNTSLIERIRAKDEQALRELYEQAFGYCASYMLKHGGDIDDAKEIFQEALYVLLRKLEDKGFTIKSNLNAYLYTICKNLWLNKIKANERQAKLKQTLPAAEETDEDAIIATDGRYRKLYECLGKMSKECEQMLQLAFFEKCSDREIAQEMNYSYEFVRQKRRRCIQSLKKCMNA